MTNNSGSMATYTTLMRVTSKGRPYCQDLNDLFSALVIQHGVKDHRYRFRTIPNSLVFSEGLETLGNLQFTHLTKTPDPSLPGRLITTRTTTTFSMSPKMGRSLAQHFATSCLLENAVDPVNRTMKDKAIWILTPKAKFVILDFSKRARVPIKNLQSAFSKIESFHVVVLERLADRDDQLAFARPNMTTAFQTMMAYLPLTSLLADDAGGIDMEDLEEFQYAFFGYQAFEWISNYTTVTSPDEAKMVASEIVLYGWINQVIDKSDSENASKDESVMFKMGRNTIYHVTARGRQVLGWAKSCNDNPTQSDIHEQVIQHQRALVMRLRNADSSTGSLARSKEKEAAGEQPTITSATSLTGAASAISSVSSTEESMSDVSANADLMAESNAFHGLAGVEFGIPMSETQEDPTLTASDPQKDLDEVTERLLHLRSVDNTHHRHQRQDTVDSTSVFTTTSTSRPSSLCMKDTISLSALDPNSSWSKLRQILLDPLIRIYFRDFLKSQFCEENVNIWVDLHSLRRKLRRHNQPETGTSGASTVTIQELLQDAYAIYDTYLALTATAEVNIDHQLRQEIIGYVNTTFTVCNNKTSTTSSKTAISGGSIPFMSSAFQPIHQQQTTLTINGETNQCLKTLLKLYDRVDSHICRIMAQDSVPKFIKTKKYRELMANSTSLNMIPRSNSVEQSIDDI